MHRRNTSNALIAPVRRKQMRFQRALEVVYGYIWSPRQVKKTLKTLKFGLFEILVFFKLPIFFKIRFGSPGPSPRAVGTKSLAF